ncbi:ATP synthase subunit I [Verrucomicrobium sp. GAS474]|uniref:ATP synthase subunit I n=1 Tax=Verrucomicrobium sp. GAS474 TaxID=1882831 RepID=UPI000B0D68F5|nr:ATP synthase subunit I [Verrucomicrobium sp. GAS474]
MNEALIRVLAWVVGVGLGVLFFGGLWWTVRKGLSSSQPAFWFFGSLFVRFGITLAGFYFVARDHWDRLLLCLLGFILARLLVMWFALPTKKSQRQSQPSILEPPHAP